MQQVAESGGTDAYHAGSILLLKPVWDCHGKSQVRQGRLDAGTVGETGIYSLRLQNP